jgi:hypothetical protein
MSKRTIEGFFPGFLQYIIQPLLVARTVYEDFLFPESVAQLCPEAVIQILLHHDVTVVIRQPALAISAILGGIIGIYGSIVLLAKKNKQGRPLLLSLSLLSFGLMNISGLFLHCLFSNPGSSSTTTTTTYSEAAPWTWMMDCYMTGVSATAFILASLHDMHTLPKKLLQWSLLFVNLIGAACVMSFFYLDATLPLELWYLLTVLFTVPVAEAFFGPSLGRLYSKSLQPRLSRRQHVALASFGAGGISIIVGLHLDATFCLWFGDVYYDALTVTNMIFLGCDLAFLGIVLWVQGKDDESRYREDYSRKRA